MKMALTAALHARPDPLCIVEHVMTCNLSSLENSFRFVLPPIMIQSTIGSDGLELYENATYLKIV